MNMHKNVTGSTRTRWGGSALGICYKTCLIYRTCMRRAPARPVRACFARCCCAHVVQEHDLRATPAQCNAKRRLSSHLTLHSSHFTLHTSHSHFTLHTSSHLKSCELSSPHLSSSHLIPSPLTCHLRKSFSTVFISSERWSTFLISSKLFSTHLGCSARQKALAVSTQKLETQMHLHCTQEKPLESIFVLQSLAHLPKSSVSQKRNPPTPAFAKAGAAPGTTGGVEPVFVGLQRLKIFLARPTPQATGTPRPHQCLLMGFQACRLPGLKPLKPLQRFKIFLARPTSQAQATPRPHQWFLIKPAVCQALNP